MTRNGRGAVRVGPDFRELVLSTVSYRRSSTALVLLLLCGIVSLAIPNPAQGATVDLVENGLIVENELGFGDPATTTLEFNYSGGPQTWTVPQGVTSASFELFGGQGGPGSGGARPSGLGGKGGRTLASLTLAPGEVIQVNVGDWGGGRGRPCDQPQCDPEGYGGAGRVHENSAGGFVGGHGGGASDIRKAPFDQEDRLLVAGGGGGGGVAVLDVDCAITPGCIQPVADGELDGGEGGGIAGVAGGPASGDAGTAQGGAGGTQFAGGAGGAGTFSGTSGVAGQGGGSEDDDFRGGGGGGGYFGGGMGGTVTVGNSAENALAGGGGGSGFGPDGALLESGVRSGQGLVRVTFAASSEVLTLTRSGPGTVTSSPLGINCGSVCSASFDRGTTVTLTAAPSAGSTFAGWTGDCTGTGTCAVPMDGPKSVSATFSIGDPADPVLAISLSGPGTVTSSPAGIDCGVVCSALFSRGSTVTLAASSSSGSVFIGWSGACTGAGTCTLTMSSDRSVGADFAPIATTHSAGGSGLVKVGTSADAGAAAKTETSSIPTVQPAAVASKAESVTESGVLPRAGVNSLFLVALACALVSLGLVFMVAIPPNGISACDGRGKRMILLWSSQRS